MDKKKNYNIVLFLFNPFVGAIYALFDLKNNKSSSTFLWLLFCFSFGYFYINQVGGEGDYYTYLGRFNTVSNLSLTQFFDFLINELDFLQYIILYLFSFLTKDYNTLWGLISLTFGYFILKIFKNLNILVNNKPTSSPYLHKITFISLIFITSLYLVYNFRFWIGASLIYLGVTHYLLGNKNRMLLCYFFAAITHFGLIVIILIIVIATYLRLSLNILALLSISSLFLGQLFAFKNIIFLPEYIMESRGEYLTDEYTDSYQVYRQTVNWYVFGFEKLLYYVSLFYILLNLKVLKQIRDEKMKWLISIILMVYTFVNLVINLPLSERFMRVAMFLGILFVFLSSFSSVKFKYKPFLYILCIGFIIIEIRKIAEALNLGLVLPTGLVSLFIDDTSVFSFLFR
jgi:hypothetical protein